MNESKKDLTLDELRERAPMLARVVSNVGTWEDHLNAMAELNKLLREARGAGEAAGRSSAPVGLNKARG